MVMYSLQVLSIRSLQLFVCTTVDNVVEVTRPMVVRETMFAHCEASLGRKTINSFVAFSGTAALTSMLAATTPSVNTMQYRAAKLHVSLSMRV